MTRWVSLSTDPNPHYAIYAPIVVRLWRRLGFNPILFVHNAGWDTAFGEYVRAALGSDFTTLTEVPRLEPLSVGNTMRTIRLAASAHAYIGSDDIVMTADIDMAPLSRSFFELPPYQAQLLRADLHGPIEGASALRNDDGIALQAGLFRLPMCYVALTAQIWRDIFPYNETCANNPVLFARRILHGCGYDSHDYDEAYTSARLLLSRYAVGALEKQADGTWRQGELRIVPMSDWPRGWPKRMLIGGDAIRPHAAGVGSDPIDFHMPKPSSPWVGPLLVKYWPEEREFIEPYWRQACELAGFRG
jgi:hypothetical protein